MTDKKLQNGQEIEIPASGALGVLALGHKGLDLWRAAKAKELEKQEKKKSDDGK